MSFRPLLAGLLVLTACAPALDWREVRVSDTALKATLPCKAVAQQRQVPLAGQRVTLTLQACSAGGQTWGLAAADVQNPALVSAALAELAAMAARNVSATANAGVAFQPPGATPNPQSRRFEMAGRLPDDTRVQMQVAVFSHGTVAFQATVLGETVPSQAAQSFFADLRVQP